jgi:hypothetical protein
MMTMASQYADFHVAGATARDAETRVVFSFDHLPASDAYFVHADLRWVSDGTDYRVFASIDSAGQVAVNIIRALNSARLDLTSPVVVLANVAANDRIALSIRAIGVSPTQLCARVWRDGDTEPTSCTAITQDDSPLLQVPGISYLAVYSGTSGTPTTCSLFSFRYLRVGPQ